MRLVMPGEDYVEQGYWRNENMYEYLMQAAEDDPGLEVVDEMPTTASGKIQKHLSKEDIQQKLGVGE